MSRRGYGPKPSDSVEPFAALDGISCGRFGRNPVICKLRWRCSGEVERGYAFRGLVGESPGLRAVSGSGGERRGGGLAGVPGVGGLD